MYPLSITFDHGDLLVTDGPAQSEYAHRTVPWLQGPRVNLTYRWVTQHAASCPLAGVVGCVLSSCVQGLEHRLIPVRARCSFWEKKLYSFFQGKISCFSQLLDMLVAKWEPTPCAAVMHIRWAPLTWHFGRKAG